MFIGICDRSHGTWFFSGLKLLICLWTFLMDQLLGTVECRWRKSLTPSRQRVGRWSVDEDKRLKISVMLFGPKSWNKIAEFVPGRTQVQCRER